MLAFGMFCTFLPLANISFDSPVLRATLAQIHPYRIVFDGRVFNSLFFCAFVSQPCNFKALTCPIIDDASCHASHRARSRCIAVEHLPQLASARSPQWSDTLLLTRRFVYRLGSPNPSLRHV